MVETIFTEVIPILRANITRSSLCRLGEEAVRWEDDYGIGSMIFDLCEAFVQHFPEKTDSRLEFEYKRLMDGRLVIKQMREVPKADHAQAPGIALIDTQATMEVFQGVYGMMSPAQVNLVVTG